MTFRTFAFFGCVLGPLALASIACGSSGTNGAASDVADAGPANEEAGQQPPSDGGLKDSPSIQDAAPLPHALLLFGGDGPTFFDDTWEWDGTQWAQKPVTGPSGRYNHAMASLGGKVVLFGGQTPAGSSDETWEWDGSAWTQKKVAAPPARAGHRMATLGSKVVMFGGSSAAANYCDTWLYDGTTWTNANAPLDTGLHCIGHSIAELNGKVYLFGGVGARSDTWAFDGAAWTKVIDASATQPGERAWASMSTIEGKIVMFGGQQNANNILSDTWSFDGTTWTEVKSTGPSARWNAGLATFDGNAVLFGGEGPNGAGWLGGSTWSWNGATWSESKVTCPPARFVYTLASR